MRLPDLIRHDLDARHGRLVRAALLDVDDDFRVIPRPHFDAAVERLEMQIDEARDVEAFLLVLDVALLIDVDDAGRPGEGAWRPGKAITSVRRIPIKTTSPGRGFRPGLFPGNPGLHDCQPRVQHHEIGDRARARSRRGPQPSSRAGVVEHISAACTMSRPHCVDQLRKRAVHRQHAARQGAVVEARDVADGDRPAAERARAIPAAGRSRPCRR